LLDEEESEYVDARRELDDDDDVMGTTSAADGFDDVTGILLLADY
jgi:hypothetical protein